MLMLFLFKSVIIAAVSAFVPKCDTTAENAAFENEIGNVLCFSSCKYIHCTEQWGFAYVNTEISPPLTVATFPLFGTTCFYTGQNNLYASTFGYNNGRITIVCEANYSGAQGFWLILCK